MQSKVGTVFVCLIAYTHRHEVRLLHVHRYDDHPYYIIDTYTDHFSFLLTDYIHIHICISWSKSD